MLLAVDAGNSMVKYAVFAGSELVLRFAVPNAWQTPAGETPNLDHVRSVLHGHGVTHIDAIAVANVGPHGDRLVDALLPLAPTRTVRLHAGLDLGVVNAYENPQSLGIDRLVNVIAAHTLYGGPVVVADIGTATNFECVGAHGEFLGGAICAGPQLGLDALSERSSRLASLHFEPPRALIATNTFDALKAGAYYGHAELVDGLLRRYRAALGPNCKTVVTGGYSSALFPLLTTPHHLDPDLTLHGVRLAYERLLERESSARTAP